MCMIIIKSLYEDSYNLSLAWRFIFRHKRFLLLQDCFLSNDPTTYQRYISSSKVRPKKTQWIEKEREKKELWIHRRRLIFPRRHPEMERNLSPLWIFGEEEFSSDSVTCSTLCGGMNNCVSGSDFYFYSLFFFLVFFCTRSRENISGMFFWGKGSSFGIFAGLWASSEVSAKIWSPDWIQMWERESFFLKKNLWSFQKIFWEN